MCQHCRVVRLQVTLLGNGRKEYPIGQARYIIFLCDILQGNSEVKGCNAGMVASSGQIFQFSREGSRPDHLPAAAALWAIPSALKNIEYQDGLAKLAIANRDKAPSTGVIIPAAVAAQNHIPTQRQSTQLECLFPPAMRIIPELERHGYHLGYYVCLN